MAPEDFFLQRRRQARQDGRDLLGGGLLQQPGKQLGGAVEAEAAALLVAERLPLGRGEGPVEPTLTSGTRWLLCGGVALSLAALTAIQSGVAGSLCSGLPWPGIGVPLILAAGLGGGLSPAAVLAGVTVVLVGEAVAGLAKQRRGTLTTGAPEEGP
jgi:hypothetical protein